MLEVDKWQFSIHLKQDNLKSKLSQLKHVTKKGLFHTTLFHENSKLDDILRFFV